MATKRRFRNDLSEAIHSSAAMLHKVGALDETTMRALDARHLTVPADIERAQIKHLRAPTTSASRCSPAT